MCEVQSETKFLTYFPDEEGTGFGFGRTDETLADYHATEKEALDDAVSFMGDADSHAYIIEIKGLGRGCPPEVSVVSMIRPNVISYRASPDEPGVQP